MILGLSLCKLLRALCLVEMIPFLLSHQFLFALASGLRQLLVTLAPQLVRPDLGAAEGDARWRFFVPLVVLLVGDDWLGA